MPTAAPGGPRCFHKFIEPTVSVEFAELEILPWLRPTTINGFYSGPLSAKRSCVEWCSHTAAGAAKLAQRATPAPKASTAGMGCERKLAVGEPLASPLAGAAPLSRATAELGCDSPDKKPVAQGERAGEPDVRVGRESDPRTQTEWLMV